MEKDFEDFLRKKSRQIAADYPNINSELSLYEHLWAITSAYEGTNLANGDMHKYATFLLEQLNWTPLEGLEKYERTRNI